MEFTIYSDGGCHPNPGIGGYGAVIIFDDSEVSISKGFRSTTNNRMELMGIIDSLIQIGSGHDVDIFSDSQYVVNMFEKNWVEKWKKNDFSRINGDLIKKLYNLIEGCNSYRFHWVKGHNGDYYNEMCDDLATKAMGGVLNIDYGYEKEEIQEVDFSFNPKRKEKKENELKIKKIEAKIVQIENALSDLKELLK